MTDGSKMNTRTVILLVVGAIVLLPLLFGGGMMGGYGMMGGGMFLWPVLLIVLVLVLVLGIGDGVAATSSDDAMTVLRERYARGELSDEEFEERRRTLRSKD